MPFVVHPRAIASTARVSKARGTSWRKTLGINETVSSCRLSVLLIRAHAFTSRSFPMQARTTTLTRDGSGEQRSQELLHGLESKADAARFDTEWQVQKGRAQTRERDH